MLAHPGLRDLPWVLEVPGFDDKGPDLPNVETLKRLAAPLRHLRPSPVARPAWRLGPPAPAAARSVAAAPSREPSHPTPEALAAGHNCGRTVTWRITDSAKPSRGRYRRGRARHPAPHLFGPAAPSGAAPVRPSRHSRRSTCSARAATHSGSAPRAQPQPAPTVAASWIGPGPRHPWDGTRSASALRTAWHAFARAVGQHNHLGPQSLNSARAASRALAPGPRSGLRALRCRPTGGSGRRRCRSRRAARAAGWRGSSAPVARSGSPPRPGSRPA